MRILLALAVLLFGAGTATAQVGIRGFADVGGTTFTAKESFNAITGSNAGVAFGGGVEASLPAGLFVQVRASRLRKTGSRLFLFEGQQFDLGIPTTITITPLEVSGGLRVNRGGRLSPYGGAGIGWHRYQETSEFAAGDDDVDERFLGFQLLGGVDVRITRLIAVAGEAQWATVPDALGQDPNSVSAAFGERDLGGITARLKIVIGR